MTPAQRAALHLLQISPRERVTTHLRKAPKGRGNKKGHRPTSFAKRKRAKR